MHANPLASTLIEELKQSRPHDWHYVLVEIAAELNRVADRHSFSAMMAGNVRLKRQQEARV